MKAFLIIATTAWTSLFVATADADIVFSYRETSSSVPGVVSTGLLAVNPLAYRTTGVHIDLSSFADPAPTLDLAGTGLDVLKFSAGYGSSAMLSAASSLAPNPLIQGYFGEPCPFGPHCSWEISLDIPAFGSPVGTIYINNSISDFTFNVSANGYSGGFDTDNPAVPCIHTGLCTFAGALNVAEPRSLVLLTVGLLGLALMQARRSVRYRIGRAERPNDGCNGAAYDAMGAHHSNAGV